MATWLLVAAVLVDIYAYTFTLKRKLKYQPLLLGVGQILILVYCLIRIR